MNCPECKKQFKRKANARYCSPYCLEESRRKRLIADRVKAACADCGVVKVLVNARVHICYRCKAQRTKANRPDWEAKKYERRKQNHSNANEAARLWNRLRVMNEKGGGWCCECGGRLNSYNRTQYCEPCRRILNRLIMTLSEAANLA